MSSTTHIAGPAVCIGDRVIQRCVVCGEKLVDNLGQESPVKPDGSAPDVATWTDGAMVRIAPGRQTLVGDWVAEPRAPSDFCLALVEE